MASERQNARKITSDRRISALLKARDCISRRGIQKDRMRYMIDISKKYPSVEIDFHENIGVEKSIPIGNMSICPFAGQIQH